MCNNHNKFSIILQVNIKLIHPTSLVNVCYSQSVEGTELFTEDVTYVSSLPWQSDTV